MATNSVCRQKRYEVAMLGLSWPAGLSGLIAAILHRIRCVRKAVPKLHSLVHHVCLSACVHGLLCLWTIYRRYSLS